MKQLLLSVAILLATQGYSQDLPKDSVKNSGKFTLSGMMMNVNNAKQTVLSYDFSHVMKYKNTDLTLSSNYLLSYKDDTKFQDDQVIRLQPRIITNNWSIFTFGQWSTAYSRKLDNRIEAGFGGGHNIIKRKAFTVTGSYGILYDNSSYTDGSKINALRHSPRVQFFGKADKLSYFTELYYQPMIENSNNYNYRGTAEIKYAVNDKLSLSFVYKRWYESYNILGIKGLNENFTIGTTFSY
jgi:hypothetical protein